MKMPQLRLAIAAVSFLFMATSAEAQGSCERFRAELASLERSGASARPYASALQRQRQEIARLAGYYHAINCGRGTLFFPDPPECNAIAARVRQMQANAAYLESQMPSGAEEVEARIRQLRSAIAASCGPEEARPLRVIAGGSRLVCVRACDGYFFPLGNLPKGDASPEELCRALCPNADTVLFRAPLDGSIEEAVSEQSNRPYTDLRNALRYTRELDRNCSCRRPGQSWAEALRRAEAMIERQRSDVVVTPEMADRLARAPVERAKGKSGKSEESSRPSGVDPAEHAVATTGSVAGGSDGAAPIEPAGREPRLFHAAAAAALTGQARGGAEAPRSRRPRIIAPEIIAVPATAR